MDKRILERAIRDLQVLSQISAVPLMHRSHPYLPDIARDTSEHLKLILAKGSSTDSGHNFYLQVTVNSILRKAAQSSEILFLSCRAHNGEVVAARRNLTKLSLIFSHILAELKALFPGGNYQGNTYQISKIDASLFWNGTFGKKCLVQWNDFRAGLGSVHPVGSGPLEVALRSTIDVTCNDHVSVFEFDIFTRLFQPWNTLLQNWMLLAVTHPGYMAFQTYGEVKVHLQCHIQKPGSYIFRLSCTHLGQWAIGYVTSKGEILQTIPHNKPLYVALLEGEKEGLYLYPNGLSSNPDLTELSNPSRSPKVLVTQEQWDLYSDMGSSFELCKICIDNEKNVRIKPCGHLLCDQCLSAWQKSDGHTCPFCRCEIQGKENVRVQSQPEPEESPVSNDSSNSLSCNQTFKEEDDWIRHRPLPPPPPNSSPTASPPSWSPLVSANSSNFAMAHSRPPLPQRGTLQASDLINGQSETPVALSGRRPKVPLRIRREKHRSYPISNNTNEN
ncbi:hypothetical protein GDO86_012300 [Hymenochirus boettgeri]|uniref:E3 ubiquitin-protein ligase CBL n=1 Tax=Hymenochirus boettgeri TaxID=247094 RepID=A0A8T2IUN8_9PIPI|nr:hypothetical protein GDO86_012300 [Hymenochirus boettgeri]